MSPELVEKLVTVWGPIVFVMFMQWHIIAKTLPRIVTKFEEALARQQALFSTEKQLDREARTIEVARLSQAIERRTA